LIHKDFKNIKNVKSIYSPYSEPNKFFVKYQEKFKDFESSKKIIKIFPFAIPLVKKNGKLNINFKLINSVIKNIQKELLSIINTNP